MKRHAAARLAVEQMLISFVIPEALHEGSR